MQTDTSNVSSAKNPKPPAEVRKFMFDRSFDVVEPEKAKKSDKPEEEKAVEEAAPVVVVPTFSEEEMTAAREESFAAGRQEGAAEAQAATEREVLVSLNGIGEHLKNLAEAQEKANAAVLDTAVVVAVGIARKLFPALNEKHALGEVERMVAMAMERVLEEPKIVVYVNDKLKAPLEERMAGLAAKAGFKGAMTVEGVDDIIVGDCRVEWTGGGARRHMDELWKEIDAVIEHNLGDGAETAAAAAADDAAPESAAATTDAAGATTDAAGATADGDGDKPTDQKAP